jgi:hypothetical protein
MPLAIRRIFSLGSGLFVAYIAAVCVEAATFSFNHTPTGALLSWVAFFAIPGVAGSLVAWAIWPKGGRQARQELRCEYCRYDLRATPQRCPECGRAPGTAGA